MRHPVGGIHEDSPGLPGRLAVLPSGPLAQVDCDRHVVFDNSLADGSWYYSHCHVVAPSELDQADGNIPVDGDHFLTPPNALRVKWRSATGGELERKPGRAGTVRPGGIRGLVFANVVLCPRRDFR